MEELEKELQEIQENVIKGKTTLLNLELVPLFNRLKKLITITNLEASTDTYQQVYDILEKKFQEFQILLRSLDNQNNFMEYLKQDPSDHDISLLFQGCWMFPFSLETISIDFMIKSKDKLSSMISEPIKIEHLEFKEKKRDFILEIPQKTFEENMNNFYEKVANLLPCKFNAIFENERDQIQIYEKFIYLLHLLQLGRIKYQKETHTLYK